MAGTSGDDKEELLFAANFASNASCMLLNPPIFELGVRVQNFYINIGPWQILAVLAHSGRKWNLILLRPTWKS